MVRRLIRHLPCSLALLLAFGLLTPPLAAAQSAEELAASLAASSPLVVTGRVAAVDSRWDPSNGAIYTYATVTVTNRLKGTLAAPQVVVKQLGGQVDTVGLRIGDQATFTVGEDVLVFLAVRPRDRTLYTAGLQLGKWRLLPDLATGNARAVPPGAGPAGLAAPAGSAGAPGLDLASVAAIVGASAPVPGSFVTAPAESRLAAPSYALLPTGNPNPARWHQVDEDKDIIVDSQTPPGGVGGQAELNAAMSRWNGGGTRLTLRFGSSAPAAPPCSYGLLPVADRHIAVYYNDPCGEISDGDPNVFGIGGGYFTSGDRRTINGTTFDAFIQGLVVINNTGPQLAASSCFQDALTHNLGHAIGLGHSSAAGAIMQATLPSGCASGASGLGADDVAGLKFIYPAVASGGTPPQPPTAVSSTVVADTVTITWTAATAGGPASSFLIDAGTVPGVTNIGTFEVPASMPGFSISGVPMGLYYVRVRAKNVLGISGPSPDRAVSVGPCEAPGTPSSFTFSVADQRVSLAWTPPTTGGAAQGYVLSVGSAPGIQDLLAIPYPASVTSLATTAPYGDYYVRVFATSACGISAPTADTLIAVHPCTGPPQPPTGLTVSQSGSLVGFTWTAPVGGPPPSQYMFAVGSAPGAADLAVIGTGGTATSIAVVGPSGSYYVRLLAANACGASTSSNEVHVVIP